MEIQLSVTNLRKVECKKLRCIIEDAILAFNESHAYYNPVKYSFSIEENIRN